MKLICQKVAKALHVRGLLKVFLCYLLITCSTSFSGEDLSDIVRNPSIGNYKAYAEFKMAKYHSAKRIWEELAKNENAEALFNLGILAEDGLGEKKDMFKAEELYTRSANAGSTKAQYRLGLIYSSGVLLPLDVNKARKFLTMAANAGDEDAVSRLKILTDEPDKLSLFDKAEKLSGMGKYQEAATLYNDILENSGNPKAMERLGWMYEQGRGVNRDLSRASYFFSQAADAGIADAQYAIGVMYQTGKGKNLDLKQAKFWLKKAAKQNHQRAKDLLKSLN